MNEVITNNTAEVLAGMFTENTGRDLLDSGGSNGRNWQRNSGRTSSEFLSAPRVIFDGNDAYLDAFQFLNERLTYEPELDSVFQAYYDTSDDYATTDLELWPQTIGATGVNVINTANYDEALSQVLQFSHFEYNGTECVLLQVHGGADIRGGYTRPKLFSVNDDLAIYDFQRLPLYCTVCAFRVYLIGGSVEDQEHGESCGLGCGGALNLMPDNSVWGGHTWRISDGCPCCLAPLS